MEKSLTEANDYEERARREIGESRTHLKNNFLETAASTAYYSCFYAVHARLARLGIVAKSHKQVGIEFRRHFIKTKKMDARYSKILTILSQWRSEVDYTALPQIDAAKAGELVAMAVDFVEALLGLKA